MPPLTSCLTMTLLLLLAQLCSSSMVSLQPSKIDFRPGCPWVRPKPGKGQPCSPSQGGDTACTYGKVSCCGETFYSLVARCEECRV